MAEILLLGADKAQTAGIGSLLRQDRHIVHLLRDVGRWRDAESARDVELIVAVLRPSERIPITGNRWTRGFPTPILIVQQDPDVRAAVHGDDRVVDRISSPFVACDLLARVDALIRVRRAVLRMTAGSRTFGEAGPSRVAPDPWLRHFANRVSSLLNSRVIGFARPPAAYIGVATRVAAWADRRDAFEPGHAERVAAFASLIADRIGLSENDLNTTVHAARLHDIGKIALPIAVLRQKSPLAADQRRLIGTHAERGANILHSLNAEASIVDAIRHHHTRFDVAGRDPKAEGFVPLSARIVAVAEVFDAMTSRQFRPALEKDAALEQLRGLRGGQLDPGCVDALLDALTTRPATRRVAARVR